MDDEARVKESYSSHLVTVARVFAGVQEVVLTLTRSTRCLLVHMTLPNLLALL